MAVTELWTIGYEIGGFPAFLAELQRAGIKTVIDVRDLPLSRRAGFSKRVLAGSLEAAGIGYVHLKGLGTPKEGRVASHRHDWATFWRIVDERMTSPEAELDLLRAAEVARASPSALLCVEADPTKCHRIKVAEALAERFGFSVHHLHVHPLS